MIAATHRDLPNMVKQTIFREDLYYRLNVFPINVPALRQRTEDIPKLVWHFIELYSRRMNKRIDDIPSETTDALVRYHWPGNVRGIAKLYRSGGDSLSLHGLTGPRLSPSKRVPSKIG